MVYNKTLEFTAAVRGYYYYKTYWNPHQNQILNCYFENDNAFDRFAIKVCEDGKHVPVGHLPREISRVTKYLLDRGAMASATLTSEHYRRSPLVQGGLEIPCKVSVTMPGTVNNLLVLEKYRHLIEELYIEPKSEDIIGSFLHTVFDEDEPASPPAKRKAKSKKAASSNQPDGFNLANGRF